MSNDHRQLKGTLVVPFSFEQKDKLIQLKREQLLKKVMLEEKKAREFHATPLPQSVYGKNAGGTSSTSSTGKRSCVSSEDLTVNNFKARPAVVLTKKAFVPTKSTTPVTEPEPFYLTSDERLKKRKEFDEEIRRKEEHFALLRKQQEEEQLRREQEEIALIRRQAEYKAQPIRTFKPVIIQASNKITEPVTPRCLRRTMEYKKGSNKENVFD